MADKFSGIFLFFIWNSNLNRYICDIKMILLKSKRYGNKRKKIRWDFNIRFCYYRNDGGVDLCGILFIFAVKNRRDIVCACRGTFGRCGFIYAQGIYADRAE